MNCESSLNISSFDPETKEKNRDNKSQKNNIVSNPYLTTSSLFERGEGGGGPSLSMRHVTDHYLQIV